MTDDNTQQTPPPTGGEGNTPTWYESAPDETKGFIQNKGWDDPVKAVTAYQELEKFRGANENELLFLPKDPEAEGAFDKIYDKLGRPDAADKYEINLPEGVQLDETRLSGAREIAHKLGLNTKQFEALAQFDAEYMATAHQQQQEAQAQAQEADYQKLISEWGDNATEREELARRGLRHVIPEGVDKDDMVEKIEKAIGTANVLKIFANVGETSGREDKITDSTSSRPFGYTAEQAQSDRKSLMSELQGDAKRLATYNQGKGTDFDKMQRLNKIIAS